MFEQTFAFSLVIFCSHAAIYFDFYCFFDFLDRIFLNGFPDPILVQLNQISISRWWFFVHMRNFDIDFLFFFNFLSDFFGKWFSQFAYTPF